MSKILIIGNFKKRKEVAYAKYIIAKYAAFSDILVSGNKYKVFKKFDTINLSSKSSDLYINYLLSADIVFILDEKTNYHKYKTNQRIINLRGINQTELCNYTDVVNFSSLEDKIFTNYNINFFNYSESFKKSNIEQVIDNLNISISQNRLKEELIFITNSPFFNIYSPNNTQRLLTKITELYDSYNIILINLNLIENSNLIPLVNNYTSILDINNKLLFSYLKHFKGIIIADNQQSILEYQEHLNNHNISDLSNKKILSDSLKLFFNETNFDEFFNKIDIKHKLTPNDYYQSLNDQYNEQIKNKKISSIIRHYNTSLNLLYRAINSVFASEHKNIEIIIVDYGLEDDIEHKIYSDFKNNAIKYIYQNNQDSGSVLNAGIKAATGDYVFFLDSNDTISNISLKLMLTHSELFNLDLVIGESLVHDKNNNFQSFSKLSSMTYTCYYNKTKNNIFNDNSLNNILNTMLIRINIFYDYDIWFEDGFYADLIFTVLLFTKIKEYHYLNIPICNDDKYWGDSTIYQNKSFDDFNQRFISYKKIWGIIDNVYKEELLRSNLSAFNLYLPECSKFNSNQQKQLFTNLKKYVMDRIDYYSEVDTNYISVMMVRCLKENDFTSFLKLCNELISTLPSSNTVNK